MNNDIIKPSEYNDLIRREREAKWHGKVMYGQFYRDTQGQRSRPVLSVSVYRSGFQTKNTSHRAPLHKISHPLKTGPATFMNRRAIV